MIIFNEDPTWTNSGESNRLINSSVSGLGWLAEATMRRPASSKLGAHKKHTERGVVASSTHSCTWMHLVLGLLVLPALAGSYATDFRRLMLKALHANSTVDGWFRELHTVTLNTSGVAAS